ncbi:MAG: carboxyl transferase domain-containing protein [Acidimicrobiales bacterium]
MTFSTLLIANRGEIACRIMRAADELGIDTVAVYSTDDAESLHRRKATRSVPLAARGAAAYLDIEAIIAVAVAEGVDAIHPGYGFLSENADFARACDEAGIVFVGPGADVLEAFGDKSAARLLAVACHVPVLAGTAPLADAGEAEAFLDSLGDDGAILLKAVGGGGGRGLRVIEDRGSISESLERCRSEAASAFGRADVFAEQLVRTARHIEVQVVADGHGNVTHLGERECTLQRQHQKLIEMAPAPGLDPGIRSALCSAAVAMAERVGYRSLGTFEFLVDNDTGNWYFIEANPRLQVEHTVTEEVTGIDLVQTQLELAGGATLTDVGLDQPIEPRGQAIQVRVNTETMQPDGTSRPTGGTLSAFAIPSGLGIRTETHGYPGYTTSPSFDSLLAKVIVHHPAGLAAALRRADRALGEFTLGGIATNLDFCRALVQRPDVAANTISTRLIDAIAPEVIAAAEELTSARGAGDDAGAPTPGHAGRHLASADPLAVLDLGRTARSDTATSATAAPLAEGMHAIGAPLQGTIVSIGVEVGAEVTKGSPLLVMEAMKMEHVIEADVSGVVRVVNVSVGDAIFEGHQLIAIEEGDVAGEAVTASSEIDLDHIRPDLAEVIERHEIGLDARRVEAVAKRHERGGRTARENVADLVDPDTFVEYGALVLAAQRKRRSVQELIEKTPGDGLVGGLARINGDLFPGEEAQCAVASYDYMVLAGTQGHMNHAKKDRLFETAKKLQLPFVMFTEGGGGRPGDTDGTGVAGLDCLAFGLWAELSGLVPTVAINRGYCFAGNAALLGCADVVIATRDSNIGMGGPAMIEGGGLGVFHPSEIGPIDVQSRNGVIDIVVDDEAEAVRVAKQYLSYFQGPLEEWSCTDQRELRHIIPENRLRIYDVREVIEKMFDTDSVLELRQDFGVGMITSLARIEGKPVGVIANNPTHLAGAIDPNGADKASRFMQLCDAHDLPIVFLCDTPGIMVGPEVEKSALVRHASRMFVTGASLTVPFTTIVLRKGYGLGAQAMAGGGFKFPIMTVGWPTSEFGGMGLEGAVKLGYRNELAAIEDPEARAAAYQERVDRMYEVGKGVSMADHHEIDDVIDPADSRRIIAATLTAAGSPPKRQGKKRPMIDTW